MRRFLLCCFMMVFVTAPVMAEQDAPITLQEVSRAQGLIKGAELKARKRGIDLKQLRLGLEQAYRQPPNTEELQFAADKVRIFSDAGKPVRDQSRPDKQVLSEASYQQGLILGAISQQQLKAIDPDAFMKGFKRGYKRKVSSPKVAKATILVRSYYRQQRMLGADERLAKSKAFLEKNAARENVIVTPSGLQYEIIKEGEGPKPRPVDMVTVNYIHTKPDSDFYYNSAEHGHSETLALRGRIPEGWRELFLLMKKGGHYRVYLSPELGFGDKGHGKHLLPNEVLITEFILLDIVPPPPVVGLR